MKTLLVIHPHGKEFRLEFKDEPSLELLQALVGGYIEPYNARYQGKVRRMWVNEDGARLGFPLNHKAMELAKEFRYFGNFVGVALVELSLGKLK